MPAPAKTHGHNRTVDAKIHIYVSKTALLGPILRPPTLTDQISPENTPRHCRVSEGVRNAG